MVSVFVSGRGGIVLSNGSVWKLRPTVLWQVYVCVCEMSLDVSYSILLPSSRWVILICDWSTCVQGVCADWEQHTSAHSRLRLSQCWQPQLRGGHVGHVSAVNDQLYHAAVLTADLPGCTSSSRLSWVIWLVRSFLRWLIHLADIDSLLHGAGGVESSTQVCMWVSIWDQSCRSVHVKSCSCGCQGPTRCCVGNVRASTLSIHHGPCFRYVQYHQSLWYIKYKKLISLQHRVRAIKSHIQNSTNHFFLG